MTVSFDINTYDLIQRSTSTAEALHELGTEEIEASYEAAETVLNDREDTVSEKAFITESVISSGPPVDQNVVNTVIDEEREENDVEEFLNSVLTGVLASATNTESFDAEVSVPITDEKEPQETYDANPEAIVELFTSEAQSADADSVDGAAREAVETHEEKLSQLSFTALAIAVEHMTDNLGVDADVEDLVLPYDESLNHTGIELFTRTLAAHLEQNTNVQF